ncbi:hypothetical protein [Aeromonas salmonicida]|uniref:hypothetical protein n=1 Tax=Aeromonas salmonicida TaxID=645 RepID=UPI00339047DD
MMLAVLLCHGAVQAQESVAASWPDTPVTRLKAQALLQTLNATLLSNPSATVTLQNWCADHRMAGEPRIRALRDQRTRKPADAAVREQLKIAADEPVGYRRVQLACGDHVFSEADNWYVQSRLTPEMNRLLDTSDTPFGLAVKALNFSRRTLSSTLLWAPLPAGWEMQMPTLLWAPLPAGWEMQMPTLTSSDQTLAIPERVLQHSAILSRGDGVPFSLVVETYRRDLFAFPLDNALGR